MIPSSRDVVLSRIRSGLARAPGDTMADASPPSWNPNWTRPRCDSDVARFVTKAEANFCTVERVATLADVPAAAERQWQAHGVTALADAGDISVAHALRDLPWPPHPTVNFGPGRIAEAVAVTDALAGVAETGSLVVCSAAERPASLNFLPDLHVCVLHAGDLVHHMEDVWPKLRGLAVWPRAVNIISGPSRTADVAQIVVRPAHGPKALHIVLVDAP